MFTGLARNRPYPHHFTKVIDKENPIQAAHRVPFARGVLNFGFTPDWLDRSENFAWACRRICNGKVEWDNEKIKTYLGELGAELPSYLDDKT